MTSMRRRCLAVVNSAGDIPATKSTKFRIPGLGYIHLTTRTYVYKLDPKNRKPGNQLKVNQMLVIMALLSIFVSIQCH